MKKFASVVLASSAVAVEAAAVPQSSVDASLIDESASAAHRADNLPGLLTA